MENFKIFRHEYWEKFMFLSQKKSQEIEKSAADASRLYFFLLIKSDKNHHHLDLYSMYAYTVFLENKMTPTFSKKSKSVS